MSALAHRQRALLEPHTSSGLRPSFTWDFRRKALHPAMSFSRGSAGWSFDSDGLLKQAAPNVPRFDHDPVTGQCLGYLAEMQSTNFIIYSADGSAWPLANVTQSTDGTKGPDGATEAVRIAASAGAGSHFANRGAAGQGAGNQIVMSAFFKQGTTRYVVLVFSGDGPWHSGTFDFQTGAWVGSGTNATLLPPRRLANGWWRLAAAWSPTNDVGGVGVAPTNLGTGIVDDISYAAAGTETVYTTGWQVDTTGVGLTSYIPTNGNTATRGADLCAMPLASMPGWDGTQGGALVAAYRPHSFVPPVPGYQQMAAHLFKTDYQNSISILAQDGGGGYAKSQVWSGGVYQNGLTASAVGLPFARRKQAVGWSPSRLAVAIDGGPVTGSSGNYALPAGPPDTLWLGYYIGHALQGTLESVAYFRGARTDAFVQGVSR